VVEKHGIGGIGLLFEALESEFGDELRVDARLERLVDVDVSAVRLLELTGIAR
jgi:hypothetical protein